MNTRIKGAIRLIAIFAAGLLIVSGCSQPAITTSETSATTASGETTAATETSTAETLPPAQILQAFGSDLKIFAIPEKSDSLHSSIEANTTKVAQITGEDSENKTLSRFSVWGTDLGSMTSYQDTILMFAGDTFASEDHADWRCNVIFIIEDDDPSDGLTITGAIEDYPGHAKEFLGARKRDGVEMTVIPTHAFTIDETLYCYYMSVRRWGGHGEWFTNYAGLARSDNGGQNWQKLEHMQWPGESGFIQAASYILEDEIYIWAIPAGRFGGVQLMKAALDDIESLEEYVYLVDITDDNLPVWQKGSDGIDQALEIIPAPVGEISAIYNPFLGNFIMTYLNEAKAAIVMREGLTPWGPWGEEVVLARGAQYPSLYGAYMHPDYLGDNGETVYFAMSQFFPIYNIMWMRTDLTVE